MSLISTYKRLEAYINTPTIHNLEPYFNIVRRINNRYDELKDLSNKQLRAINNTLKYDIQKSSADTEDIIEAFALIKVLAYKILGLKAYDVQLVTGLVLYEGRIAEMQTGEGKTLAALFPTYLRAIEGKGIHIHTFNDYLAQRDHEYFKPLFNFLEITSSCIQEGHDFEEIEDLLKTDVTYGSAKQFLYTFLKQSIADPSYKELSTRYQYAIIDEADAILLDEATNPFVIAGNQKDFNVDFYQIAKAIKSVIEAKLYGFSDFKRSVYLDEEGVREMERNLGIENLFDIENANVLSALNLSLHAHVLLQKDEDYIVSNDEILLVDEFTGRIVIDRKWRNGLQTAVEAKEGLPIKSEGSILNSISIPNFYQNYKHKAAMTATAEESATELNETYGLVLVVIPPIIPTQREDLKTRVFKNRELKNKAVIEKITELHKWGRPVLVGTQHIAESEWIYDQLRLKGLTSNILNAKNDQLEAEIIANAGMLKAITISTNMAGRGTDIKLGGPLGIDKERIKDLGGLFVIGTNMHRSGRIDRQLSGRAARQGEVGGSQFFVSLEDDLFDENKMFKILPKKYKTSKEDEVLESDILKYLKHAQEVAEDQDNLMRSLINSYNEISHYQAQLIQLWKKEIWKNKAIKMQLKKALIADIDQKWADHLSQLFEVKDGIHFISLGGQNPLRAYRIIADNLFKQLEEDINKSKLHIIKLYEQNRQKFVKLTRDQKPSSTWTYTVSDKGFSTSLESLMKDNSNIAFQVDFLGLTALLLKFSWLKINSLFNFKNKGAF